MMLQNPSFGPGHTGLGDDHRPSETKNEMTRSRIDARQAIAVTPFGPSICSHQSRCSNNCCSCSARLAFAGTFTSTRRKTGCDSGRLGLLTNGMDRRPNYYHERAARCARRAKEIRDPTVRETFEDLARHWDFLLVFTTPVRASKSRLRNQARNRG